MVCILAYYHIPQTNKTRLYSIYSEILIHNAPVVQETNVNTGMWHVAAVPTHCARGNLMSAAKGYMYQFNAYMYMLCCVFHLTYIPMKLTLQALI